MATRTTIITIDDLDGSADESVATVRFSFAGTDYEIDLHQQHQDNLRLALEPYIAAARPAGRAPARKQTPRSDTSAIRAWANANNIPINERGRIPATVHEQYLAANR